MSPFDSLSKGMLSISARTDEADGLVVQWVGRSDERDPAEFLNPYLGKLAGQAGKSAVVVDFRRLEYMNSSTIKPIIRFVQALAANAPKVTVHYNAAQKWQAISFDALRTVFLPLKNVAVVG